MAYIGRDIQYGTLDKQSFTANSSTTVFTLNTTVKDAKSLLVSVGGVIQEPDVAYTASGTTLTFSEAPVTGNIVYVIYLGKELIAGATRESITYQSGTGNNTTTPVTLSAAANNAQSIMVMLNGVTQTPETDYTVNGTTLTFNEAVPNGVAILVYHLANQAQAFTVNDASVTNAHIVSLDASKLTGSLPGSMGVNTTTLDQSIASLGLHVGVSENKIAYNLPESYIDVFQDDSGILTETDVDRDTAGEYVASASETVGNAAYVTGDRRSTITATSTLNDSGNGVVTNLLDGTNADNNTNGWLPYDNQDVTGKYIRFDYGADTANHKVIKEAKLYQAGSINPHGDWKWQVSNDATTWTDIGSSFTLGGANVNTLTELSANTSAWRYYQVLGVSGIVNGAPGNTYSRMTEWEFEEASMVSTTNATGTLISKASTAANTVSTASGVMLYEDAEGTGTLGTDLKVHFSSDDGANWTEAASYGNSMGFSGNIKMVPLGQTTLSGGTGTAVKMKAEWANQAAGQAGQTGMVAQATGTIIGDFTTGVAIGNAFDGTQNAASGASPHRGGTTGFLGKDWGSGNGKIISGVKIWAATNTGYINNNSHTFDIRLYGSNTAPANATDGTLVGTIATGTTAPYSGDPRELMSGITATQYQYIWVAIIAGQYVDMYVAEVEFYESTPAVDGKVQRLHGWAVNY